MDVLGGVDGLRNGGEVEQAFGLFLDASNCMLELTLSILVRGRKKQSLLKRVLGLLVVAELV